MSRTPFFDAFATKAEAGRDRPFLIAPDGGATSYGAALERSARMARAMRTLGLVAGDRVVAMTEKSADAVLLYLACLQSGLVYVPVNPAFRAEETAHVLADASPVLVVCDPGQDAWFGTVTPGTHAIPLPSLAVMADSETGGRVGAATGGPAVILYTSGTTGRPKGAMLSQDNILANAAALGEFWRFDGHDVLLHVVPLFHSHGLFVSLGCTLMSGSTVLLAPRFAVDETLALLPACTVFMGVPTMYTRLAAHPGLTPGACRSIRLFACGSAPLSPADHALFTVRTGHEIVERYGMSETSVNTSNPIEGLRKPGSVGLPLPGVEVRIAGGEIGAVQVRGGHVFGGYWNRPAQTAEALAPDGWFDTGDLGSIDTDGYLVLAGRAKELMISGGFNVYPIEVERVLQALPDVLEAAVIGPPHPDFGEAVTAVLVAAPGAPLHEASIIAAVKDRLAAYKAPKRVLLADALPRNAIGKVQKTMLQAQHASLYET